MPGVLNILLGSGGVPGAINQALPNGAGVGTATWQLTNDGTYLITGVSNDDWVTPSETAVAAFYEVKVDPTAGSFTTGTTGSFLSLGTTRTWTLDPDATVTFTVTIREITTGIVRSTQTGVTLSAATV